MMFFIVSGDPVGVMQIFNTIDKGLILDFKTFPKTKEFGHDHSLFVIGLKPNVTRKDFILNLNFRISQRFGPGYIQSLGLGLFSGPKLNVKMTFASMDDDLNKDILINAVEEINKRNKLVK